jgi:hypothetical protein
MRIRSSALHYPGAQGDKFMLESGTRTLDSTVLERESRVRKAERAERILGLVLWVGLAMTVLVFARV